VGTRRHHGVLTRFEIAARSIVLVGGVALAVAPIIAAAPTEVLAQSTSTPSSTARELFNAGVSALREGRYRDAVGAFERALAIERRTTTLCNLALAYDRWGGHEWEALESYARCAEADDGEQFRATALARARELAELVRARGEHGADGQDGPTSNADSAANQTSGDATTNVDAAAAGSSADVALREPSRAPPGPPATTSSLGPVLMVSGAAFVVATIPMWIGGAILYGASVGTSDRLAEKYPGAMIPGSLPDGSPNPEVDLLDQAQSERNLSIFLLVSGGVLVAIGAGLMVWGLLAGGDSDDLAVGPGTLRVRF
jgi:tetratricopeptide (TPR) repeat protein